MKIAMLAHPGSGLHPPLHLQEGAQGAGEAQLVRPFTPLNPSRSFVLAWALALPLKKAKLVKVRSNEANWIFPSCRLDSSSYRTRTSVVSRLRKKLKDSMDSFKHFPQKISSEYKETVQRRYFTVTGENPDEKTIDLLISTGKYMINIK
ncbi:hypothetical protein K1719_020445 [Acacia pycnantha]|nr:hypothetical protein K1719_020445 [Acacia pycnantha]